MVNRFAAMLLAAVFIGVAQGADLSVGHKPAPLLPGVSTGTASEKDAALNAAKVPRAVIIKLRDTVTECLSCRAAAGRSLNALMPGSRLGDVLSRHGMKSVHPLRPAAPGSLVPESRAVAQQRRAANRARFAIRSSRAPRGAQRVDFSRTYVVRLRRDPHMAAVAREIAKDPAVEFCEPDGVVQVASAPNDPFFSSAGSWGQNFDDLWGIKRIGAPAAWDTTRGAGVIVATTDTGLDYTHADIGANVWTNPGEIPDNGVDDDGNGYIDDVHGYDFADGDGDPLDDNGHGTHVAGTIAALGNNGAGVVGVAYEAQIMAVRGLGRYGTGSYSALAQAIAYAVDNGADVINASWVGGFSQTIADAMADAHAAGVVFVAAAGNSAADVDSGFYPAADRNAITVSAFDHLDQRASFSNYGAKVDVAAPGGGDAAPPNDKEIPIYSILSLHSSAIAAADDFEPFLIVTAPEGEYLRLGGTSMAAPHVSGVAALLLAHDPSLTVEQVRQLLRTTADDVGAPGRDLDSGYGLVNAAAAVTAPAPLEAHIDSPDGGKFVGETSIDIVGSAAGPGFDSYTLEYRPASDENAWTTIAGPVAAPVSGGLLASWDVTGVADGDYVVHLVASRAGEPFEDEVRLTLLNAQITEPAPLTAIGRRDTVDVVGTAAGGGFVSYLLEYRRPSQNPPAWQTAGLTPEGPQTAPVRHGLLGTLDVSGLAEGDRFDFRLTVTTTSGVVTKQRGGIVIDPTIRAGWPQQIVPVSDHEYLTVADLDGDGIQEILVGSGDEVVVFEPDGSVRAGWPQSVATKSNPFVETRGSPIVADITGDDALEVIATNHYEVLAWTADGVMLPGFPVYSSVFANGVNDWLTAGDRDGDGKDDIICTGVTGLQVFRGDGTEVGSILPSRFGPAASAAADVTGDARVEIGRYENLTNRRGRVRFHAAHMLLLAPDDQTIAERRAYAQFFTHVSMADLDADGTLDMVTVHEDPSKKRMRLNSATAAGQRLQVRAARFKRTGRLTASNGQVSYADIDRDGIVEAWAFVTQPPPGYFENAENATGYFVPFLERHVRSGLSALSLRLFYRFDRGGTGGIAIGDVDGDGEQELVGGLSGTGCGGDGCLWLDNQVVSVRRGVVVQKLDGTLLPKFPKPLPALVPPDDAITGGGITFGFDLDDARYGVPAIADLDGDGLKEIIWVDPVYDGLWVWNVDGTPGPLVADWPMYHGDPKHSNVFPVGGR